MIIKPNLKAVLFTLLIFLIISCSSQNKEKIAEGNDEKSSFQLAKSVDLISIYKDFIQRFPESPFSEEAKNSIQRLLQQRAPDFQGVQTIQIVIEESYSTGGPFDITSISLKDDFRKNITGLLKGVGLYVSEKPDTEWMLKVKIRGVAHARRYRGVKDYLYTGASVKGSVSIERNGEIRLKRNYEGKTDPPYRVPSVNIDRYKSARKGLFKNAFNRTEIHAKIAELLGEVLGHRCVINLLLEENVISKKHRERSKILEYLKKRDSRLTDTLTAFLKHQDKGIRINATKLLTTLKDPKSVEALIEALNDPERMVRRGAVRALKEIKDFRAVEPLIKLIKRLKKGDDAWNAGFALEKITGQRFGIKTRDWSRWWKKNKKKYLN